MTPVRVLALIDSLDEPGGAERLAVSVACALDPERFRVTFCATRTAGGPLVTELADAGIRCLALGRRGKADVAPFRRLFAYLRRERIEIVHSHMFGSNLWASLVAPPARVPVRIAHEHGSPYEGRLGYLIRTLDHRVIGPLASAVVVGTQGERDRLIELGRVPARKVRVIPAPFVARGQNPVDLRGELGLDPGTRLIGTVAWLRPEKALEVLVDAFAALAPERDNAHLVIAGEGPCRTDLDQRARAAGISDRVHLLGARDDPVALLADLDVAAISSDRESTSLVALETMAAGTPLVSTRVGGPAEFLADGESALLVPTRDPAAMSSALCRVLDDPALGKRLSAAAGEQLAQFDLAGVAAMHADLYEHELERHGRRASCSHNSE